MNAKITELMRGIPLQNKPTLLPDVRVRVSENQEMSFLGRIVALNDRLEHSTDAMAIEAHLRPTSFAVPTNLGSFRKSKLGKVCIDELCGSDSDGS